MKLLKIENLGFIGISIAVILLFFYLILGFSAMMAVFGIIMLFIAPIYLILDSFDLEQDEKIVFSFFIGVGIFPTITYWLGMIMSFRIAIFITFLVLIIVGYLVGKIYKKKIQ